MVLFLILVSAFLLIVGLHSYIRALVSPNAEDSDGYGLGFLIGYFSISIIMLIFEAVLLLNPVLGFACAHWGWILGISLVMATVSIVIGAMGIYYYVDMDDGTLTQGVIHLVIGILILFLMIFGLSSVRKSPELTISNSFEIRCLANMPKVKNGQYYIQLDDDIDFNGKKASKLGRYKNSYIIDGNGYAFKNIEFDVELKDDNNAFFKLGDMSEIDDLKIVNCKISLIPNNYDDSNYGYECDYSFFGENETLMNNVVFENVIFYAKDSSKSSSAVTPSTIGNIETYGSEGITILRESEENDA